MRADLCARSPSPGRRIASETGNAASEKPFRVALTGDFHDADGNAEVPRHRPRLLSWIRASKSSSSPSTSRRSPADQLAGANGAIVLTPRVTADEPRRVPRPARDRPLRRRLRLGRCRGLHRGRRAALHRGRARSIAPSRRPPSAGCSRSRTTSARRTSWSAKRGGTTAASYMGTELRDRTLGVVGFGGIGRALVRLLAGFGMKPPLVFDPFVTPVGRDATRRHLRPARRAALRVRLRLDPLPAQRRRRAT